MFLVSATGGVNPTLASGAVHEVSIRDIDGVTVTIDGQVITGTAESLQLKLDKKDPARVKEFRLVLISDSSLPEPREETTSNIQLSVPQTSIRVISNSPFSEHKGKRDEHSGGYVSAKLSPSKSDHDHKKKSKQSEHDTIASAPIGVDPGSLSDSYNALLRERTGACVVTIPTSW